MAVISYAPSSPQERIRRRRVLFTDYNSPRYKAKAVPEPEPEPAIVYDEGVMLSGDVIEYHTRSVATSKPRKGVCRHCGEHIGRGVAFHEKKCEV